MAQKKLVRFAKLKTFSNTLEYPENMAGNWHTFFKNDGPIVLELACGRGEYTIGLARMYPDQNFIGVDVKGHRMYIGAKTCMEEGLQNAGFLRTQIDKLPDFFAEGEVNEIWITFPDPQLRTSKARKRLTHPQFLRLYQRVLVPGGSIHLKTDSPQLYAFTRRVANLYGLNIVEETDDVYAAPHKPSLDIKTHYEAMDIAQSNKIYYLHFTLPASLPELDDALQEELKTTEKN